MKKYESEGEMNMLFATGRQEFTWSILLTSQTTFTTTALQWQESQQMKKKVSKSGLRKLGQPQDIVFWLCLPVNCLNQCYYLWQQWPLPTADHQWWWLIANRLGRREDTEKQKSCIYFFFQSINRFTRFHFWVCHCDHHNY